MTRRRSRKNLASLLGGVAVMIRNGAADEGSEIESMGTGGSGVEVKRDAAMAGNEAVMAKVGINTPRTT